MVLNVLAMIALMAPVQMQPAAHAQLATNPWQVRAEINVPSDARLPTLLIVVSYNFCTTNCANIQMKQLYYVVN